jgi:hypothetical protein
MWQAQRKNLGTAGIRRLACALLLTGVACSDNGPDEIEVAGLRFVTQPANVGAGVPMTVTVELLSDGGTRITGATDEVTLSASGGATLGGTTTVDAVAGLATFSGVTLSSIGQNIQLTASTGDINATSTAFAVVAGPATAQQSTMTVPTNVTANANATLTFTFKDAGNNPIINAPVSFSTNLAGSTFTPATGTTDATGAFSTVFRATGAGSASITVTVGGTSITFPTAVAVAAGASALRFVTQPANVGTGAAFSVAVEVLDNTGQRLTTATNPITLTLSGGTLTGTATANAVAGLATFNGLSISGVATGTIMTATSGTLTVQSSPFNVTAGPPTLAQSSATFAPTLSSGTPSAATFTFRDAGNNPVANAAVTLTSTIAGTTFAPSSGTTNATGVFTSTITAGASGVGTVTATVGGTGLVFNVIAGPCAVGTLTLGTSAVGSVGATTGCSLNNHPAATFRFTIPAGNATVVTVSGTGPGGAAPELAITADPPTAQTLIFVPTATALTQGWLLAPGTYLATGSSPTGAFGDFTVTTANAGVGAAGCVTRVLVPVTATYLGQTLSSGPPPDCVDTSGPFFEDSFAIFDDRQCTITVTATTYDAYLIIRNTAGAIIGEDDDSGGGTNSRITRQCRNGTAPIIIGPSSFDPNITGAYTLTISFPAAGPGQVAESITIPAAAFRQLDVTTIREVFGKRAKR